MKILITNPKTHREMKKLLIIGSIFLSACNHKREKPFVIVSKTINSYGNKNECSYYYDDKNGNTYSFTETNNKYSIGDTIK